MSTTALTIADRARTAIGLPAEIEQQLTELAKKTTDIVVIVSTEDRAQVHGALMTIKNQRIAIENAGKTARDDANKFAKAVIAEAGRLCAIIEPEEGRLFDLRKKYDDDREAEKQSKIAAELKRVADLQARVAYLGGNSSLTSLTDPVLIAEHISDLESEVVDESMEEYRERADAAKATGIARLQALHAASIERVAEAARIKAEREELAQLREQQAEQNRKAQVERDAAAAKQQAEAATERERIAAEDRAAKVKRDAEAAELKAAQVKAQTIIDTENARVAAANKVIADKLAADRAELERRQADERKAKAEEEARRAEQARIAALVRPTDEEMIDVLAIHYNAPASRIVEWILSMNFSDKEEAAA